VSDVAGLETARQGRFLRRRSRRSVPAVAATSFLLVAAACGGGGSRSSSGPTTTTHAPTTTSATSATTATTEAPTTTTLAETSTTIAGGQVSPGGAAITSVAFTGTTVHPTVTITGTGLGQQPAANPTYTPEGHPPLCPLSPAAEQGYDYGTSLYLYDSARNWAGGRYRPELGELDCIGLIVSTFTPTKVVFQFGSAYAQYQNQDNYLLAEGDGYQLAVNGATAQGSVHYTAG